MALGALAAAAGITSAGQAAAAAYHGGDRMLSLPDLPLPDPPDAATRVEPPAPAATMAPPQHPAAGPFTAVAAPSGGHPGGSALVYTTPPPAGKHRKPSLEAGRHAATADWTGTTQREPNGRHRKHGHPQHEHHHGKHGHGKHRRPHTPAHDPYTPDNPLVSLTIAV